MSTTATTSTPTPPPAEDLTPSERTTLLSRISHLESQLRSLQATHLSQSSSSPAPKKTRHPKNPFNPSHYHTRPIALKFTYLGHEYNGYEHANNPHSAPPKPTIEEVLWKALRKARLISPLVGEGADDSFDVVWDERERAERYGVGTVGKGRGRKGSEKLEISWEGCEYSKCGRTDKGVSGFGQVVGIRVRSCRPKNMKMKESGDEDAEEQDDMPTTTTEWDSVRDELPYVSILNSLFPPSIRVLAWCPDPPAEWDARFACKERRYKYFFTNPAFCPTPGPLGFKDSKGREIKIREGWLDIEAMKVAAKKLEGLHDFRNFCKIDASKQMSSCDRRIMFAAVEEFTLGVDEFVHNPKLNMQDSGVEEVANDLARSVLGDVSSRGPKVYSFAVHGTAFLWHQVRCMAAVLFLVGQGLEKPEIVDELFDIVRNPGRPHYEMADDTPLVLWDCVYPGDGEYPGTKMNWIYAGDAASISAIPARGDGKFGVGGVVETLWAQWREAKLKETLTAGLLGLALSQGDGTPIERGGYRDTAALQARTQKLFDGGDSARPVGDYVPIMQKPKMEPLEVLNARFMASKQARKDAKRVSKDDNSTPEVLSAATK